MARPGPEVPLVLMNDAALALPTDLAVPVEGARLIIAGTSRVRLTLATLALPEAMVVWTDFGQSASLAALGARVRAEGRLDRLVLSGDGADGAGMFAIMQTILTFLPLLKRGSEGGILLVVRNGPALVSLTQFLQRLRPSCDRSGIKVELRVPGQAPLSGHHALFDKSPVHGVIAR